MLITSCSAACVAIAMMRKERARTSRSERKHIMSDLMPYGERFEKVVDIIEAAKERAYRKVNEELS